jgi:hypothetical protein
MDGIEVDGAGEPDGLVAARIGRTRKARTRGVVILTAWLAHQNRHDDHGASRRLAVRAIVLCRSCAGLAVRVVMT